MMDSSKHNVDDMVSRFLGWPLPKDFSPDCGISFDGRGPDARGYDRGWPIGTNLLTADQAKQMFEHCLKYAVRPTDDHLWDETLRDRDNYHEWADKLAGAIAIHFGVDIGEHSNMNSPWGEALDAIESAQSADPASPQQPDLDAGGLPPLTMSVYGSRTALELERQRREDVAARNAYKAPAAGATALPDEPTEEMRLAFVKAYNFEARPDRWRAAYRAMLAARSSSTPKPSYDYDSDEHKHWQFERCVADRELDLQRDGCGYHSEITHKTWLAWCAGLAATED